MIYFMDDEQRVIKGIVLSETITAIQEMEIKDDSSLLQDVMSVSIKNDLELSEPSYFAVRSDSGVKQSFDMYEIKTKKVDEYTTYTGIQLAVSELGGYVVEDIRPQNRSIEYIANQLLSGTDWEVRYVDKGLPTVSTNFYYMSIKDALKWLQSFGCEMVFRVEISGNKISAKTVDIYRQMGSRTGRRFTYGSNALKVVQEVSHAEMYSALIGRGKGEEVVDDEGEGTGGFGRKITFEDVEWRIVDGDPVDKPLGQKYVEIPSATDRYGIQSFDGKKPKIGLVDFGDVEDPKTLLRLTYEQLLRLSRPSVEFKSTIADVGDLDIGDTVIIHRHDLGIHYEARVFRIRKNRKNKQLTEVSLGDRVVVSSVERQRKVNSHLKGVSEVQTQLREDINFVAVNGRGNKVTYGNTEPTNNRVGDEWFRDHPSLEGESQILIWNGEAWELIVDTSETTKNADAIAEQQQKVEEAKQEAEKAYNDAVAEAERLVGEQTVVFDAEMDIRKGEILEAKEQADLAVSNANANAEAIFGKLDMSVYEANKIEVENELGKKLETAIYNAQKQTQDALIAGKVAISTYDEKVAELNSLIDDAQSKADTAVADLLNKADTSFVNTELAKKLATSTYNTKMASLDTAISGHDTRIKATEDGLVLTATKVEVDAVRTRMSEAETEISQNSEAIALKASQSSLDTTNSKLASAEAALVVQAGEIKSKVSQLDFNALDGRVSTAETTISQQAGRIDLAATKTELTNAIDGVQVGGRNLLRNSKDLVVGGLSFAAGSSKEYHTVPIGQTLMDLDAGTEITISFDIQMAKGEYLSIYNTNTKGPKTFDEKSISNIGTKKQRVSITTFVRDRMDATVDYNSIEFYSKYGTSDWYEISNIKIETGNKATDWTPAPEDVDASIATVQSNLTIEAGKIASKVSQTDFNVLSGRVGTAESTITQQAGEIESKVSQADFNVLSGRVGTAESSISQQAGEIALRVTTATYNAGIGSKENTITKANKAPAHLNGRLWLDTSATPNILKRSTGSAWVKVTPTTAGEVGAYSAGAGSALAGRVSTAETSITANTTAIGLRATKTDLDTIKGRVTTTEGAINVQAGQIALKANQTTVDSLTGRVGTAETNISANTTAINLRATKTSVDTLAGRVSTAEGTITAQAGQIALRATTATVNALTGRVSAAEASLSVQSGKIDLAATKSELNTAIDGIEIGGRNYFTQTISMIQTIPNGTFLPRHPDTPNGFRVTGNSTATGGVRLNKVITGNGWWTVSFDIRGSQSVVVSMTVDICDLGITKVYTNSTNTYERRSVSVNVTNYTEDVYNFVDFGAIQYAYFWIDNIKVEKGNKATDWNPAPEDVDSAISTVQSSLTVEAGKITALTTRVSGAETSIATVSQTVSGINTTISTLRTDVNGKATIVALNEVKSTADGNKTTISNHAGRLTTVESNVNGLQVVVADKVSNAQFTVLSKSVSSVVSDLDNLEIGGRNLLKNSNNASMWTTTIYKLNKVVVKAALPDKTTGEVLEIGSLESDKGYLRFPYGNMERNEEYTFSVWIKRSTAGSSLNIGVNLNGEANAVNGGLQVGATTDWQRISVTRKATRELPMYGFIEIRPPSFTWSDTARFYIWRPQLEKGNKATDWTEAPEDVQSQITQLSTDINLRVEKGSLLSQININAGKVLISSGKIMLDGDTYVMGTTFVNDVKAKSLEAITANITSIRSQILVTNAISSDHIQGGTAMVGKLFSSTASINELTSKTAFINNIKAIEISADKITTGTLNASKVSITNLSVKQITGLDSNFIQSTWNGLNTSVTLDSTGLRSISSRQETRLSAGKIRFYVDSVDRGSILPLVNTSDSTRHGIGMVAAVNSELVLGRYLSGGGVAGVIEIPRNTSEILARAPIKYMAGSVVAGTIYGHSTSGLIITSNVGELQFYHGGTALMYGVAGGLRMYRTLNMNSNSIDNVSSLVTTEVAAATLRKVSTLETDNLLKFRRAGVTYSEMLAGGFRMHIQINMNTQNISGVGKLTYASDARYKSNIATREVSDLDIIRNIRYVDYTFNRDGSRQRGLIAQELMNADSKLVTTSEDGYLSYDSQQYTHTIGHGLQELDGNVRDLKDGVLRTKKDLLSKIEELQNKIQQLEERLA